MAKVFYLNKFVLCGLCAVIFCVSAFAQTERLENDLKNSFRKYDLVKIDTGAAFRNAQARQTIVVPTARQNYELNVMPHDLRTRAFRAEATTADGTVTLDKSPVTTFKGKISGESESEVRLTIDATKIEGYFVGADGAKLYIESAQHFSKYAAAKDFVVFAEKDFLKDDGFECLSELGEKIERGREIVGSRPSATSTLRVIEIATEADNAYVNALGGAAQANNEILGILNLIEGTYESELGLTFDVVFQHAWTNSDPFNGSSASLMLASFRDYWNANYPTSQVPRDVAHIWTGRGNFSGVGLTYLGTVCRAPASAYGLSGRFDYELIQYVLSAHEIGHSLGANHVGSSQGCDNTIMIPTVSNLTPLDFCQYSRGEIANFVASNGGCLSERTITVKSSYDFDGDGKSDISVFRPSSGTWYLQRSQSGFAGTAFGISTDKAAPADYDGDGKTDVAVFRPSNGTWYLQRSQAGFAGIQFGMAGDLPVPADYDGDGKADLAVFRPSNGTWYLQRSQSGFTAVAFGQRGDLPVAADYDGDGKADINVFRPATGGWYRINSQTNQFYGTTFGQNGDLPLIADFDGDAKADLTVYRPATGGWYRITSSNNSFAATSFGIASDIPTPADYDGDGKTDISVFRSENGAWYRYNSGNGALIGYYFGMSADIPLPGFYLQ